MSFDPTAGGGVVFQATYGHYAGKYGEAQLSRNTNVGNPDALFGVYTGPPGQGRGFAPRFDPANYVFVDGSFPTANVRFDNSLSSPITHELTLQAGVRIGRRAYAKAAYVNRHVSNFVEDFVTLDTGSTTVSRGGVTGEFANILYPNSDLPTRRYGVLQLSARHAVSDRWTWNAAWTIQLQNEGNFEGEATNQPGVSSVIGEYSEAFNERRHYAIGRLASFERHALRAWSVYGVDLGRAGALDVAGFFSADSPLTYSLRAAGQPLTPLQEDLLAAYVSRPASQTIYFAARGSEEFSGYATLDAAVTYRIPVQTLRPSVKLEMFNVFNNQKLVTWNTAVRADPESPLDDLGLPTGYVKSPTFGQAPGNGNYPSPRAFLVAFGVRF